MFNINVDIDLWTWIYIVDEYTSAWRRMTKRVVKIKDKDEEIDLRFLATDLAWQIIFTFGPDFPFGSWYFLYNASVWSKKIKDRQNTIIFFMVKRCSI